MSQSEIFRVSDPCDEPRLKEIWKAVFGDSDEYIDAFFENVYDPGECYVAQTGGEIACAVYQLPVGRLVLEGGGAENGGAEKSGAYQCAMTYALATMPEHRGRGYGADIVKFAAGKMAERGMKINILCPAEKSLFSFYERKTDYRTYFYLKREFYKRQEIMALQAEKNDGGSRTHPSTDGQKDNINSIKRISAKEYSALRERLLEGRAHIEFSEKFIEYQRKLCESAGGGLFEITISQQKSAAAAEYAGNGKWAVKELLLPRKEKCREEKQAERQDVKRVLKLICDEIEKEELPGKSGGGVAEFEVRRPSWEKSEEEQFAMLKTFESIDLPDEDKPAWYGFSFD